MSIHKLKRTETNELKQESRYQDSSLRSDADQSKHTYTAIIFNDIIASTLKQLPEKRVKQPCKTRQSFQGQLNNVCIQDLLTVKSIVKMISSHKEGRKSANLFANTKVNKSIDETAFKTLQRPVSAFTRHREGAQFGQKGQRIKQFCFLGKKEILLSGKNCFDEITWSFGQKEGSQTYNKPQPKPDESPNMYGYIAKSRLLSTKSAKKSVHSVSKNTNINKKQLKSQSQVNFQALYKNLLANNRIHKSIDKSRLLKKNYAQKQKKDSLHKSLKLKESCREKQNKQKQNTLIIIKNQRNQFYANQAKETTSQVKGSIFSNSFHRYNSKVSLTTEIRKSMKKRKDKISKIMQMNKQSVVEPKLLIQNVQFPKKSIESTSNTASYISNMSSHKNITKYLTKLSYSAIRKNKSRERDTECRLTVQCKKMHTNDIVKMIIH